MTSSSRLASDNHEDQPMDAYLDQVDTTYSRKHTTTTLIKEDHDRHNPHAQHRSRSTTLGGTSSAYHHSHPHQQQAEAPVEIYRDPSPDAADGFDQHSHHNNSQQNTMDPDYGDQENIRPRPRAATVGDPRAQAVRDKASSSSSSSHHHQHQRPSARTELLERSRPHARPVSSSSSSQAGTHQQTRDAPAPLVRKRSVYVMEDESSSNRTEPLEQAREQLKQTHVGKSVAGAAAASRVDAPKKQRREAGPSAQGQGQAQQNGGQTARQRAGSSSQKQGEEDLTEEELKEVERKRRQYLRQYAEDIAYGTTYEDSAYEYRNVILPKTMFQWLPRHYFVNLDTAGYTLKLLSESQWRAIGLQMSQGWEHYMQHAPEPHIMPFRRDLETSRRVRREQQLAAARDKKEEGVKTKTGRP
ncbi:hypothetical protein BG003_001899 [Podila horticola]|nr:hypothetical protein BG003_001899 [Podila horticola]